MKRYDNENLEGFRQIGFGEVLVKGNERRTCQVKSKRHASNTVPSEIMSPPILSPGFKMP